MGKRWFCPKNSPQVVKNAFSWGLQKLCDSMHQIYLVFFIGQIIRNLDRICQLVKCRCDFSEYSISSPTKRIFLPKLDPPKEVLIFPMQNHEYHQQNMHGAKFCTKIYANGKKSQVNITWRSRLPTQTASTSSLAASRARTQPTRSPHVARALPALTSLRITVDGLYCTPTENLSRFCKIFIIFRINCFPVWNN